MLKAVSKDVLQPFAGELRTVFSTVKGLRNPLYIYLELFDLFMIGMIIN